MANQNPMILESALIERLSNTIAGVQEVGSLATYELRVSNDDMPPLNSLYVFPTDDTSVVDTGEGFAVETQVYVLSIIVSHIPSEDYGNSAAIQAGEIMVEIAESLIGWAPEYQGSRLSGFERFMYKGRSDPNYAPGFAEFPVLYETNLVLTGN